MGNAASNLLPKSDTPFRATSTPGQIRLPELQMKR